MYSEKKDKIILDAGYNVAINEVLKILKGLNEFDIISDRLERLKWKRRSDDYEGKIIKYYEKGDAFGFLIKDDIFEITGIVISIEDKEYMQLPERECICAKNNFTKVFEKVFTNKDEIDKFYMSETQKYKKRT